MSPCHFFRSWGRPFGAGATDGAMILETFAGSAFYIFAAAQFRLRYQR
jgi:hypothetical protein